MLSQSPSHSPKRPLGGLLTYFTGKSLYWVGLSIIAMVVLLALAEAPWRRSRAAAGDNDIEDIAALRRRRLLEEEARRLSMVATNI